MIDGARGARWPLAREADGYFSGILDDARAGDRYWFRLDGTAAPPGSGVALSARRAARAVSDRRSRGVPLDRQRLAAARAPTGQVVYEMHVGTFTPEGRGRPRAASSTRSPISASP